MTTQHTPSAKKQLENLAESLVQDIMETPDIDLAREIAEDHGYILIRDAVFEELVAAVDDAARFLMGQARRDPQERKIVEQLRDALATARDT